MEEIMERYCVLRKNRNQYSLWNLTNDKISGTRDFYQAFAHKKEQGYFQTIIYTQRLLNMMMYLYSDLNLQIDDLIFDNSDITQKAHIIIDQSYQNPRQIVWLINLIKSADQHGIILSQVKLSKKYTFIKLNSMNITIINAFPDHQFKQELEQIKKNTY